MPVESQLYDDRLALHWAARPILPPSDRSQLALHRVQRAFNPMRGRPVKFKNRNVESRVDVLESGFRVGPSRRIA